MADYNDSGFLEEQDDDDDDDVDRSKMDDGDDDEEDNFSEADRSTTAEISSHHDSSRMAMAYPNNYDDDDEGEDSRGTEEDDDAATTEEARVFDEEEDDGSIKSHGTADVSFAKDDDEISISDPPHSNESSTPTGVKSKIPKKSAAGSSAKKGRTPSVQGLAIPFRTIKKSMKLDPDIPIVQNEAAIMTTMAVELFLKRLAQQAFRNAKNRGRNTVRYEDIAEARTNSKALAFLEPILP